MKLKLDDNAPLDLTEWYLGISEADGFREQIDNALRSGIKEFLDDALFHPDHTDVYFKWDKNSETNQFYYTGDIGIFLDRVKSEPLYIFNLDEMVIDEMQWRGKDEPDMMISLAEMFEGLAKRLRDAYKAEI